MPSPTRLAGPLAWLALSLLACGAGSAGPAPSPTATPAPTTGVFSLVFADEFDVPGAPDPARWNHEIGYIANDEKQYYTSGSENARVEDGALVIEARRERRMGYDYTSARLNTKGRAEFLYGKVEIRAKLPTGRGTWPALWMLGANIDQAGWPACGEIDIMENVGFDPQTIVASVHTAAYNHVQGTQRNATIAVTAPWADFHVYSAEWYPDHIDAFVDGQKYFTFRNEGTGSRTWPFDRPQFLILNLAIGGTWGGQKGIDDTLFPHRLVIDYVRVYQQR
ncbi:MAG TPA: glycoside hydrolase family 16 protein [Vicinamibacteria bacterium]|nr:glycoside hydrolase family 16 protein [Vicinamibacteria bacterium]